MTIFEFLELAKSKQPQAMEILHRENFTFDDLSDRWQKLAFTFYSDLCELHAKAELLLRELEEGR